MRHHDSVIPSEAKDLCNLRGVHRSFPSYEDCNGRNLPVRKISSRATHEPHNHQNHKNCSHHTHT